MSAGVLAIISKSLFERDFPDAAVGSTLAIDRYNSTHPALHALGSRQPLFLVTVRPGDVLWLVAVLPSLAFKDGAWVAKAPNLKPVTDLTRDMGRLAFQNGKGVVARPGMLGMSLQTPRPLRPEDVELLLTSGEQLVAVETAAQRSSPSNEAARDVTALVREAVQHAETGDFAKALELLVEAWRLVPATALADAIEAFGARVPAGLSGLSWDKAVQSHRAELLMPVLTTALEGVAAQSIERMDRLSDWPADPRLDAWLVRMLDEIPFRATSSRPFWTRLVRRALQLRDARGLATLERCRDSYDRGDYFERYLAQQVERILESTQPVLERHAALTLPTETTALLSQLRPTATSQKAQHRTVSELFAAVLLDPTNDAARFVLADALQTEGDPRGELIALQHESRPTPEQLRQAQKLIHTHFERLAGPLAGVITKKHAVFRKGFLAEAKVKPGNPRAWRAVIGHSFWATVESLEGPPEVALHSAMRVLHALTIPKDDSIETLCGAGLRNLKRLSCSLYASDDDALTALKDCTTLPSLVQLSVDLEPDQATTLLKGTLVRQLEVVHLLFSGSTAAAPGPSIQGWLTAARKARVRLLEVELRRGELTHLGSHLTFELNGAAEPALAVQFSAPEQWLPKALGDLDSALVPFAKGGLRKLVINVGAPIPSPSALGAVKTLAARLGATLTLKG